MATARYLYTIGFAMAAGTPLWVQHSGIAFKRAFIKYLNSLTGWWQKGKYAHSRALTIIIELSMSEDFPIWLIDSIKCPAEIKPYFNLSKTKNKTFGGELHFNELKTIAEHHRSHKQWTYLFMLICWRSLKGKMS